VDRFSKFFHQFIHRKILYVYTTKIILLHYLMKFGNQKILPPSTNSAAYRIFTLNVTTNMFN